MDALEEALNKILKTLNTDTTWESIFMRRNKIKSLRKVEILKTDLRSTLNLIIMAAIKYCFIFTYAQYHQCFL